MPTEDDDSNAILELQLRSLAYLWLVTHPEVSSVSFKLNTKRNKKEDVEMTITNKVRTR